MGGLPIWLWTVLLGLGTVFVGLIFLIYISKAMSALCRPKVKQQKHQDAAPAAASAVSAPEGDRGAFTAAVSAALAESMGTSVSGIRIHSIKKIDNKA